MIHAVLGRIGAGKTTYARKLAAEHGALFFSIDQWIRGMTADENIQVIDIVNH